MRRKLQIITKNSPKPFINKTIYTKRKRDYLDQQPVNLIPVEETLDFCEPNSDLNLFLTQKIKEEALKRGLDNPWSLELEKTLLEKITPEFKEKFPHYRLNISVLKSIWERITSYIKYIRSEKNSISADGSLNVPFFIKENLKAYHLIYGNNPLQAYQYIHQISVKLNEGLNIVNGSSQPLDKLTKMIWSVQRHLLSKKQSIVSAYDDFDELDKFIIESMLDYINKNPKICQKHLEWLLTKNLKKSPASAKVKKLLKQVSAEDLERRIRNWSMQGDLSCVYLNYDDELFNSIKAQEKPLEEVLKTFDLSDKSQVINRYKKAWYTVWTTPEETAFDRFIKWHAKEGLSELAEICQNSLPLIPFDMPYLAKKLNQAQSK